MKNIHKEGDLKIPEINLNYDKGLIELKGRSTPENTNDVYQPIIEWVKEYIKNPKPKTVVNIHFEYYNSSSAKYLARFFEQFIVLKENDLSLEINWFYDDEELMDSGHDFSEIIDIDFNFISTK